MSNKEADTLSKRLAAIAARAERKRRERDSFPRQRQQQPPWPHI